MNIDNVTQSNATPWNKGKSIGQKRPLRLKEVWAIRARLELANKPRDLALFNLAIDSKLRACDLVRLKVQDLVHGKEVLSRAIVVQKKTGQLCRKIWYVINRNYLTCL